MKLENWALKIAYTNKMAQLNDFLSTPCQLIGTIYEDPLYRDGRYIITDVIIKIENGVATTRSGQLYKLGYPLASFNDYIIIKEAEDAFKLPKKP